MDKTDLMYVRGTLELAEAHFAGTSIEEDYARAMEIIDTYLEEGNDEGNGDDTAEVPADSVSPEVVEPAGEADVDGDDQS